MVNSISFDTFSLSVKKKRITMIKYLYSQFQMHKQDNYDLVRFHI